MEIHEQRWCPSLFRDGMRGLLQQISSNLPGYEGAVGSLLGAMEAVGTKDVLDLCAGAGGPWVRLYPALASDPRIERVRLTDLFPDLGAMRAMQRHTGGLVVPHEPPIDALDVPRDLPGLRTIFAAFHHFDPQQARRVLADAVEQGRGVAVFELTERTFVTSFIITVISFPLAALFLPLLRPFRWGFLPFTYLLPVIPFVLAFDGLVSCLRSYTAEELLAMGREVGPDYEWSAGRRRAPGSPFPVIHLVGVPRRS